ncbi:MAG: glycosyltransferase [Rhodospirillaceae bacterium]|nr:glycosyltransferase [Rhodospirillaceae bacterium]MBT5658995.1 glycosyltransferase [Rhodospirillaceae bacterium]
MAGAEHGGAETFFTRMAIGLQKAGLEQELLIRGFPERSEKLSQGEVTFHELPFGGRFDVLTKFGFRRAVSRFQPDIVLTWMSRATQFCPGNIASGAGYTHVARLGGYYDMKYYQECDHLIANTQGIYRYICDSGWPEGGVTYLPNFVDDVKAEPMPRAQYSTPAKAPLILALGRLHENKGFDVLIESMAELPHVNLWLAGEGPLRDELEALAVRVGVRPRVRFLGWIEDTAPLFAAADMLICPSRHEPLGNVIIEGWAQRLPVIAAKSDGPCELIQHDKNGLLVPVDDVKALGAAIKRLLLNPGLVRTLIKEGRKSFKDEFTERMVVSRYMAFFDEIGA